MSSSSEYVWDKTVEYSFWWNILIVLLMMIMIIIGSIGYFILLHSVFGKVNFSIGSFLVKCLIIYIFSVLFHELGHLLLAHKFGYPFRIFKAGCMEAYNNTFRNIRLRPIQLFSGGFVMLNFNEVITSKEVFNRFFQKDFFYISFGGIFANLLSVLVGILLLFHPITIEIGYLFFFYNLLILLAQFIHPSDFTKFQFIQKNPMKAAVVFSEELVVNKRVNSFLENLFHSYINDTLSNKVIDQHTLAIIQRIIEYNGKNKQTNSKEIQHFISWFITNFTFISTMQLRNRIPAERLLYTLIEYNLVEHTEFKNYKISRYANKHPLHSYYLKLKEY